MGGVVVAGAREESGVAPILPRSSNGGLDEMSNGVFDFFSGESSDSWKLVPSPSDDAMSIC